ncbi:hypothetical protein K9F17_20270, partial [Stenotrophomonas acidaminiphila]|nr:hypothetical protein [Stenotrophomonas acidaminiphila]
IVADETCVAGDTDFQAALTKMKGKDFDAIVVPGYYNEAGKIVNQARGMGIDKPIVGGDGFNGEAGFVNYFWQLLSVSYTFVVNSDTVVHWVLVKLLESI